MATTACPFVWYELATTDMASAAAFYRHVIGWDAREAGPPHGDYTVVSAGPTMIGGIMPLPPHLRARDVPSHWIGYIAVDDADATVARITAAGGALHHGPADIPMVGRFAVVSDPGGASFVVLKPQTTETPTRHAPGTPGTIGWRELRAADGAAAAAFYAGHFGWTEAGAIDMGEMGVYRMFATGGDEAVGGIFTKPPQVPTPHWMFYINVDAIDAAAARATGRGATIVNGPMEVPGGQWVVQCMDPQGAQFAMVAAGR